jgi:transposase InsO family protein
LIINMEDGEKLSLEQIRAFVEGMGEIRFKGEEREEVYGWMTRVLRQHGYARQGREVKGLLRRYLRQMTGLSRAQVTRLVAQFVKSGEVKGVVYRRHRFASRFARKDIELLGVVDGAHDTLSGPATKRILEREFEHFGRREYAMLSTISAAHIYNLRKGRMYRQGRMQYQVTRPTPVRIGERRQPRPEGKPGYLRVDTVHQGDRDGVKGVYHINAVDEVTQWEVTGAAEQISEAWLEPLLEAMLEQFPFWIHGFHSDNGSEFINHTVEKLLNKLLVEQTKSRPRHSNDNGLVESKNGAVIRKHMGYGYIASRYAREIQVFYERYLNPYLNFHRPCGQPEIVVGAKGKEKRIYRRYATPWETFQNLPEAASYLKPGQTIEALKKVADMESDTDSARKMQNAKRKLFQGFQTEKRRA